VRFLSEVLRVRGNRQIARAGERAKFRNGYNSHRVAKNADACANELVVDNSQILPSCYILHAGTLEKGRPS
jgi:hypothetical protein